LPAAREGACAPEEIILAAPEILWTPRKLVGNTATTCATAEEIVFGVRWLVAGVAEVPAAVEEVVWATAGVLAAVAGISSALARVVATAAWLVLAVHWLVLKAKTIVLAAAITRLDIAKMREKPIKA
jgi:hypothetical protein